MEQVAQGWNGNNAPLAAAAFTDSAVYLDPPDRQRHMGRQEILEFFGGAAGRRDRMEMTWHHLWFDPATQSGAGEFTFRFGGQSHGVVVVQLRDGRIHRWREYWYASTLSWEEFTGVSRF